MLRSLSIPLLALLLVGTLFWGGCISCSQFFMFPNSAAKSCCNKAGQCERSENPSPAKHAKKDCNKMPMEVQGSAQGHVVLAVLPDFRGIPPTVTIFAFSSHRLFAGSVEHSPPDLQILHSSFLV
ncbi:MAG: hypothetical protein M3Z23_02765 [Acidobacteriota bacterium]|nr:hypothetical protein [Acidobacteriota bacterium]